MADIQKTLSILWVLEFENNPKKAMELNSTETGWTYKGIYQTANPNWEGWKIIRQKMQQYNGDMKLVGDILYDNPRLEELVENIYRREYWDKMKLDEINSQKIADEMFIFGVNTHPITAIKIAQKIVESLQDGIIGKVTIGALNNFDENIFSEKFDVLEKEHYQKIVIARPEKKKYLNGWRNRAEFV